MTTIRLLPLNSLAAFFSYILGDKYIKKISDASLEKACKHCYSIKGRS
jgi:hypothetical protein